MDIKAVKRQIYRDFIGKYGIQGVGIAGNDIQIYLTPSDDSRSEMFIKLREAAGPFQLNYIYGPEFVAEGAQDHGQEETSGG